MDVSAGGKASEPHQLTSGTGANWQPRWAAGNTKIFFLSNRGNAQARVFAMDADGKNPKPITPALNAKVAWAVSVDGRAVAIAKMGTQGEYDAPNFRIKLFDTTTSIAKSLVEGEGTAHDLVFSSDGKWLAFAGGRVDLFRLAASDGSGERKVANLGVEPGNHAIISRIVRAGDDRFFFGRSADRSMAGRSDTLYSVPQVGGTWETLVPREREVHGRSVSGWPSPDGKSLAIATHERDGGFGQPWYTDVSVRRTAGPSLRQLTNRFPRPFYSARRPRWLPDSRHLAFTLAVCPDRACVSGTVNQVIVDTHNIEANSAFLVEGRQLEVASALPQ